MFTFETFSSFAAQSRRGNSFQVMNYKTSDAQATVLAAGYFDQLKGKVRPNDQIWIFSTAVGAGERPDYMLRITVVPTGGSVETVLGLGTTPWVDDGAGTISPSPDGTDVSTGSGDLTVGGDANIIGTANIDTLTASQIVETDASKNLVSSAKSTAYNKAYTSSDPLGDADSASQGAADTLSRSDHQHPKVPASTTVVGQIETSTPTETQTGTAADKAVTPVSLASLTSSVTRKGLIETATVPETVTGTDTERATTSAGVKAAIESYIGLPLNYISGFVPSNDATDLDHDISFGTGVMRDNDNSYDVIQVTDLTKQIDASWSDGDDAGGLAEGLTLSANTTYHLFEIFDPVSGLIDSGFDVNIDGSVLVTGADVITYFGLIPEAKRVGSVMTDASSNILGFNSYELSGGGLEFIYSTKTLDQDASPNETFSDLVLSVPTGISFKAHILGLIAESAATTIDMVIKDKLGGDEWELCRASQSVSSSYGNGYIYVDTSATIQIRESASNADTYRIWTLGFIDERTG